MSEQTDGYYTYRTLGPAHAEYRKSGFTETQVLELGRVIAHFMGPFAKLNGQKFYRSKVSEARS